jgi:ethanolamine utilization protein EutN
MQIGRVVGTATSTVKHPTLAGWKLLVVQLLAADGNAADGEPILAIDSLGAGLRDRVMVTNDGKATRELIGNDNTPARWSVLGIEDP